MYISAYFDLPADKTQPCSKEMYLRMLKSYDFKDYNPLHSVCNMTKWDTHLFLSWPTPLLMFTHYVSDGAWASQKP